MKNELILSLLLGLSLVIASPLAFAGDEEEYVKACAQYCAGATTMEKTRDCLEKLEDDKAKWKSMDGTKCVRLHQKFDDFKNEK